jgi:hypothetical protein
MVPWDPHLSRLEIGPTADAVGQVVAGPARQPVVDLQRLLDERYDAACARAALEPAQGVLFDGQCVIPFRRAQAQWFDQPDRHERAKQAWALAEVDVSWIGKRGMRHQTSIRTVVARGAVTEFPGTIARLPGRP